LSVEPLERRDLLANLLYVGPANGNFNNPNHFINETTGALVRPAAGDNLDFNPNLGVGNFQGSNTAAVDDEPANFQFGNITLAPEFTATVTMLQRTFRNNTVTLAGGTLQTAAGAIDTIGGTFTWNGGTLAGTWWVGDSTANPPFTGTMTIQLNPQIQNPRDIVLNGELTVKRGEATWASRDITLGLQGGLAIDQGGTFTISGTGSLTLAQGWPINPGISNYGTFRKINGQLTTSEMEVWNYGTRPSSWRARES
jgi:hypothetical protein